VFAILMRGAHMPSNIPVGCNRRLRAGLARLLPHAQNGTLDASKQQIAEVQQQDNSKTTNPLIARASAPRLDIGR
jgi:hypothetical protein